jgi:hypothetical protein
MIDDRDRGAHAVELDDASPPRPARRHRFVTAPSGTLLFVCLFLPALRVCNEPTYPTEVVGVQAPYLLGLLVAIAAVVTAPRVRDGLVLAARFVVWATIAGWGLVLVVIAVSDREVVPFVVWLPVSAVLVALFGWGKRRGEVEAALVAFASGVMSLVWFALMVLEPSPMYGAYLSVLGSAGLVVGGLWWRREAKRG